MKNMGPRKKVHFFQVAPFYYFPLIIVGLTLTTILTGFPDLLPYSSLWYLGTFLHYIAYDQSTFITCICSAAYVVHALNAGFAYYFSRIPPLLARTSPTPSTPVLKYAVYVPYEVVRVFTVTRKLNLTNSDTIKWCMQSFILGYPSTRLLRAKLNKS